jgi:hypothetical protein
MADLGGFALMAAILLLIDFLGSIKMGELQFPGQLLV